MRSSGPIEVLCVYRPRKGNEAAFLKVLHRHWATLHAKGLTSRKRAKAWRGQSKKGAVVYFEIFEWKNADAVASAHQSPEVLAVWEPMERLTESMEFFNSVPVPIASGTGSRKSR